MKKWLIRGGVSLLLLVLLMAGYGYYQYRSMGFGRTPVYETEAPKIPDMQRPAMLVFSKTNAFIHKEAIPAGEELFQVLAEKLGWTIYVTENGAVHNVSDLARFDVIIWNNVTGDVLTEDQRKAMKDYIQGGGGWLGVHGAGDGSHEWPWYRETLIGAEYIGHPMRPQLQQADVIVERPDDPIMSHLPSPWQRVDEWYSFAKSPRESGVTVLATLDENSYSPVFFDKDIRMGNDHPIIWKRCVGKGRTFYSAMGHTAETFAEPDYVQMMASALHWLAGGGEDACR